MNGIIKNYITSYMKTVCRGGAAHDERGEARSLGEEMVGELEDRRGEKGMRV